MRSFKDLRNTKSVFVTENVNTVIRESTTVVEKLATAERKKFFTKMQIRFGRPMKPIDPSEYPEITGMEGPFRYRSGRILYYDPKEGQYYDKNKDMYLDTDEAVLEILGEDAAYAHTVLMESIDWKMRFVLSVRGNPQFLGITKDGVAVRWDKNAKEVPLTKQQLSDIRGAFNTSGNNPHRVLKVLRTTTNQLWDVVEDEPEGIAGIIARSRNAQVIGETESKEKPKSVISDGFVRGFKEWKSDLNSSITNLGLRNSIAKYFAMTNEDDHASANDKASCISGLELTKFRRKLFGEAVSNSERKTALTDLSDLVQSLKISKTKEDELKKKINQAKTNQEINTILGSLVEQKRTPFENKLIEWEHSTGIHCFEMVKTVYNQLNESNKEKCRSMVNTESGFRALVDFAKSKQ